MLECRHLARFEEALKRLDVEKEICVDVETSGLDWKKQHICGYVLTFGPEPQDSYYLPVRHQSGGNLTEEMDARAPQTHDGWDGTIYPVEKEIVSKLDQKGKHLFFHNGAFDLRFLYRVGLNQWEAEFSDTMINAVLINEFEPSFSLDNLSKSAGVAAKKVTIYDYLLNTFPEVRAAPKQAMGHFWRLRGDDKEAVEYAEGDGTTTWQLRDWQIKKILDQELAQVHKVESDMIPVLARMMTHGVRIDEGRLEEVKIEVARRRDRALATLPEGFNSRSPVQVKGLMMDYGYTDWPLTPKGSPSFNEQWLMTNSIGRDIVAVRKFNNILASFLEPMSDVHMWNGRVHTEYNQLRGDEYGTITGRLSSSNPNLQQVPKRNKEIARLYRSIFIPEEGHIWGAADYSQMEPRLLAYYSRSRVLMDGYLADPPLDAHLSVAKAMNPNWEELNDVERKERRENGKRVNQTLVTGGGKRVIVERYGVDPNEVDRIWNDYFNAMPEIKQLQKRAANKMKERGYVLSLLGRRARLLDPNKAYIAVNRLLQCGNADCLKYKMVEIDKYLRSENYKVRMLNNCHDALDYSFAEEDRKIYEECLRIMTTFDDTSKIKLDLPIAVDAGEGPNWEIATFGAE